MTQIDKCKFLTVLKNLYSGDRVLVEAASRSQKLWEDAEREAFDQFQLDVGALFTELREELDAGLEDLGDYSDPDPRKWTDDDWVEFYVCVTGHRFEDIYTKMVKGQPNIDLIWGELENRIDFS